jgi:hypothetical protein
MPEATMRQLRSLGALLVARADLGIQELRRTCCSSRTLATPLRSDRSKSEEELGRDFPDDELGALPPLGALLDAQVYVDPEVLGHDTVTFAAGTQNESVKMQTQELFGTGGFTTMSLVKQPERASDDRMW